MYLLLRRSLLSIILFFSFYSVTGQVNSPYSRYALGNIYPASFDASNAMGGLSAAFFTPTNINYLNPASYADIGYAIFDVGAYSNFLTLETVDDKYTSGDGNLSHMAFGFPVLKKLRHQKFGISFGLIPYSSFQYDIEEEIASGDPQLGNIVNLYSGEGSLYQFYGGLGYKYQTDTTLKIKYNTDTLTHIMTPKDSMIVSDIFSIGGNAARLFGTLTNSTISTFPDQDNAQSTKLTRDNRIGGLIYNYGLGYQHHTIKLHGPKRDYLIWRLGAAANPQLDVNGLQSVLWTNILKNGNYEFVTDTLYMAPDTSGSIKLPTSFRVGASFSFFSTDEKKNQFTIGAEYIKSMWGEYEGFQSSGSLANNWRASIGAEFIPKNDNPYKLTPIRVGGFTGTSYLQINGEQLKEYGGTFGIGIPVGLGNLPNSSLKNSRLNLSATVGSRGTTDIIKETFYNFGISITLVDDGWFKKFKLN